MQLHHISPAVYLFRGAELGPGMPMRSQASVLIICQSPVSLLPSLFRFFFKGSTNLSTASKPNPWSSGIGMNTSTFLLSEGNHLQWDGYPPHQSPTDSLLQSSSQTHCLLVPPVDSSRYQSIYVSFPLGCQLRQEVMVGSLVLVT